MTSRSALDHDVMKKILVFTSDIVPLGGIATSGGGLRSWQIIKGLQERGFDVTYSMPRDRFLRRLYRNDLSEEHTHRLWTDTNQDEIIRGEKPDVIVCVKPSTLHWKKDHGIPVAMDFHGPDLMEYERIACKPHALARFAITTQKVLNIGQGDFFTCAGNRQRYYFMAFLMMAGVDVSDLEIHYMPVAMSSDLPGRDPDLSRKSILFAGGFYPWLNPITGLGQLARVLEEIGAGHLDIFGGSHNTNRQETTTFDDFKRDMTRSPRVSFHGYVSREELIRRYSRAYAAFELMPCNPERELAFTTRTVEFLWAGLPVIYNDYAELSELIDEYRAGWTVPADDPPALLEIVRGIMSNPDQVADRSANAQRLVREHFVYDKVIEPLAQFCANPTRRKRYPENNFLIIPSRRPEYGYIDAVYSVYKRSSSGRFIRELLAGAFGVIKRKLQA